MTRPDIAVMIVMAPANNIGIIPYGLFEVNIFFQLQSGRDSDLMSNNNPKDFRLNLIEKYDLQLHGKNGKKMYNF